MDLSDWQLKLPFVGDIGKLIRCCKMFRYSSEPLFQEYGLIRRPGTMRYVGKQVPTNHTAWRVSPALAQLYCVPLSVSSCRVLNAKDHCVVQIFSFPIDELSSHLVEVLSPGSGHYKEWFFSKKNWWLLNAVWVHTNWCHRWLEMSLVMGGQISGIIHST